MTTPVQWSLNKSSLLGANTLNRESRVLFFRAYQILLQRLDAATDIEAAYAIGLGEADYKNRMATIRRKLQMIKVQILKLVEIFRNMIGGNPEAT